MNPGQTQSVRPVQRINRQARAERILNAAEELLLKHGYRRITIDDIARQTGIGKGTIYLHWKSKEALFGTLFLREVSAIWTEMLHCLRADPQQVLFSQVVRSLMLIGMQRPLARALFTWDRELLGKLLESGIQPEARVRQMVGQGYYLKKLRKYGLLRSDQDLAQQNYALRATISGFLVIEPKQSEQNLLTLEQRAEALAQTVRAAFEPEQLPGPERLKQVAAEMNALIEELIAAFEVHSQ